MIQSIPILVLLSIVLIITSSITLSVSGSCFNPNPAHPICRFAPLYNPNDLYNNLNGEQDAFLSDILYWEGQFISSNSNSNSNSRSNSNTAAGLDYNTMLTLDGSRIDLDNGLLLNGGLHSFTAASKESIHIALLALLLNGDNRLTNFFCSNCTTIEESIELILLQLSIKVNSYELFNLQYPAFGGFLPWISITIVNNTYSTIAPTPDFINRIPALDNGELIWAVIGLNTVLEKYYSNIVHSIPFTAEQLLPYQSILTNTDIVLLTNPNTTLIQRWNRILQRYIDNSMIIFYESTGRFRAVSRILNPNYSGPITVSNYKLDGNNGYLDDPYEGELFTTFAYLYCNWSIVTTDSPDLLWIAKRAKLELVYYELPLYNINITVQRGFWFSSHEQWKYLFLPYELSEINYRIFLNGERARTVHSALKLNIPGFYASVTGTANNNSANMDYISDCGIESIAMNSVSNYDIITPYAIFPLFLANRTLGFIWYQNILLSSNSQNCYGSIEGLNITGNNLSPVLTWDTKITTILAMLGGINSIIIDRLKLDNKLLLFISIIDREWNRVFNNVSSSTIPILGESIEFQWPKSKIPHKMKQFSTCK